MSKVALLNSIRVALGGAPRIVLAGKTFDPVAQAVDVATLKAAGGIVVPAGTGIAAAAALANAAHAKGGERYSLDAAMIAAAAQPSVPAFSTQSFGVNPGDLPALSTSVNIAALPITPKRSGTYLFGLGLNFTLSAAAQAALQVAAAIAAPGKSITLTGGVSVGVTGGWVYETAGHIPVVGAVGAGGTFSTVGFAEPVIPTATIAAAYIPIFGMTTFPLDQQSVLSISLGMGTPANCTGMFLSMFALEL